MTNDHNEVTIVDASSGAALSVARPIGHLVVGARKDGKVVALLYPSDHEARTIAVALCPELADAERERDHLRRLLKEAADAMSEDSHARRWAVLLARMGMALKEEDDVHECAPEATD